MDYKKYCQMVEKKKSPTRKIGNKAPTVREKSKENTNREGNINEDKKKSIIKVPKALIIKFQEKVQAQQHQ